MPDVAPLTDIEKKGLKVFVGGQYQVRVAESKDSTKKIDFTQKGTSKLLFPTSMSLKKDIEVIESERMGILTALKFLGKTQITGDLGDVATPNGMNWYSDMVLGGTFKSEKNDQALISIEADGNFIFKIEADKVSIIEDANTTNEIQIAGKTVKDFIDEVNKIKDVDGNQKYLAILHIGEGTENLAFELKAGDYNCSIREFFRVGALSEDYKKTIAPFINFIIPRMGDARYFNLLESSARAPMSYHYYGCRFLSLNSQYQNNNLTNLTANIWGGYLEDFKGTPTQSEVDDLSPVYAQTNSRTRCYVSKQRATTVASMTNAFQWSVEPQWNITNEPYEIPNSKYSDSYDFEAMFNEQSKKIFEENMIKAKNISLMLDTNVVKNGKEYKYIKSAKTLLGQPQYPDISGSGVIQLNASGFTAVASPFDPYTSMIIVTSDIQNKITYTEDDIKKDFPDYIK